MNPNSHTKYNHRRKFRDYEKRISHYVKSALFFDNGNELYENIRHNFEMREKKDPNIIVIQNQHRIKIRVIKNSSVHFKKIDSPILTIMTIIAAELSVKTKTFKISKRRQANVYVEKTQIIQKNQKQNVSMNHKSLILNDYIFEPIQRKNHTMRSYLSDVNAMISNI